MVMDKTTSIDNKTLQTRDHPHGEELERMIDQFGADHSHLAQRRDRQVGTEAAVAWMVSNCLTESNRCRGAGGGRWGGGMIEP